MLYVILWDGWMYKATYKDKDIAIESTLRMMFSDMNEVKGINMDKDFNVGDEIFILLDNTNWFRGICLNEDDCNKRINEVCDVIDLHYIKVKVR